MNDKRVLAIIPARAGSKRLPRKNILMLQGKPLIQWTIDEALKSNVIDTIAVSTDDTEIIDLSVSLGLNVPFVRPEFLSGDKSSSIDVIKHAIDYYQSVGDKYDYVMLLQPTSPLRTAKHIDEAFQLLESKDAEAVVSVCECEHSPLWSNTLPDDLSMDNFIPENIKNKRSQDLGTFYRLNGAIYIAKIDAFLKENALLLSNRCVAYKMSTEESVDIDERIDFLLADAILRGNE